MIGVVLDTNVLVSANLNDEGLEAIVVSLALARFFQLYVSEPILAEYERVLNYPRLHFPSKAVAGFMHRLQKSATVVHPTVAVNNAGHEFDNRFLECAQKAAADFLVTGNLRHFPTRWKTTKILNSRLFLADVLQQPDHDREM
jgi:putative PIN family toxin of toxin-antitoxin system